MQALLDDILANAKKGDKPKLTGPPSIAKNLKPAQKVHYQPDQPLPLFFDTSDVAIDAVLEQYQHDKWLPVAYLQKKLSSTLASFVRISIALRFCPVIVTPKLSTKLIAAILWAFGGL